MNDSGEATILGYVADSGENFILIYRDDQVLDAMGAAVYWANAEDVAFSWIDAACLTREIRDTAFGQGK